MSSTPEAQRIRRWQEEVARDPASPAFVPLADVYRREGRLEVARRLCIRGLQRQPEHVDAHVLLARVQQEAGEMEAACDELDIALRLDPTHQAARRALGYLFLERRDWPQAVQQLEKASAADPHDARLASALALARRHAASDASPLAAGHEAGEALGEALRRFVREARVEMVLLLEGSGRIVARLGSAPEVDLAAFASLSVGIHSASREMARMLGQAGFEQLYQGRDERQIFFGVIPAAPRELILAARFGAATTIGLVRVRFLDLVREVADLPVSGDSTPADAAGFEASLAAGLRVR